MPRKNFDLPQKREVYYILPRPMRDKRRRKKSHLPLPRGEVPQHMLTLSQYAALGRVVVETTYLEHYLHFVVPLIAGMKFDIGQPFVQGRPVMAMLQLLEAVALPQVKGKRRAQQFSKLIKDLKKAVE